MSKLKNPQYQLTFDENGTITEFTGTLEKIRNKLRILMKPHAYSYFGDSIEEGMRKTDALEMFMEYLDDETSGDVDEEGETCETGNFNYTIKKL